jgi:CelD/BcsL family acetyltransferase involved in cellulose biosynthesis
MKLSPVSGLTMEIVRGRSSFAADGGSFAEICWGALDSDPECVMALAGALGEEFEPFGVLIKDGFEVRAAAMMRFGEAELPVSLGYRLAYRPLCLALVAQRGIVGAEDPSAARLLLEALRAAMEEERIDAALIPGLRVGSALEAAGRAVPWPLRGHYEPPQIRWRASIPASRDELIFGLGSRTRGKLRRLEARFRTQIGNASIRRFDRVADIGEGMLEMERVAERTWQRKLGNGFRATHAERVLYEIAASKDAFRSWVLYDGTKPIAFLNGLLHEGVFAGRFMGYDPDYAGLGPGVFLFSQLVGDLCEDERVHHYDFGSGDSDFKRRFGDESWFETDLLLVRSSPRGLLLNFTRSGTKALQYAAKSTIKRYKPASDFWTQRRPI